MASATMPGEAECGDLQVVQGFAEGVLIAVADGLGHGADAAAAARLAGLVLRQGAGKDVVALVQRCHELLRNTRGAVLTVASIDARERALTWLGVGNVEAVLRRAPKHGGGREHPSLRNGVVGGLLPPLRPSTTPVAAGDVLILATDGLHSDFARHPLGHAPCQRCADEVLASYGRPDDDALVLVTRFLEGFGC